MLISYSNPEKNTFYLEMGLLLNPFVLFLVNKLTCIIPKTPEEDKAGLQE